MQIVLTDITRLDLDEYEKMINLIKEKNYMSRYFPYSYINSKQIHPEELLWKKIIIAKDNTKEFIGSVWIEKDAYNEKNGILGIFIGKEKYQGKGIGTFSVLEITLLAKKLYANMEKISLHVRKANERAILCYKKCGFIIIGEDKKINEKNHQIEFYRMEKRPTTAST